RARTSARTRRAPPTTLAGGSGHSAERTRSRSGTCPLAGRFTTTEHIRRDEVVPPALGAHLDDVHRELGVLAGERGQLTGPAGTAVDVGAEAVAVGVGHRGQALALADRTRPVERLAVVASRAQQVGLRVAHIGRPNPA